MTRATGPYPFPAVAVPARHFVALTAVVIVFLAHLGADTLIDEGGLFLLLGIVVLGSAWFAGTGSALSVTVLGAVLASVVAGQRGHPSVEAHLALFVGQGLLLTALVAELRRARRAAERDASLALAAQAEAEAASRMKDEFLGTISHELRTPLNAVLGWLHLIKTGKLDEETTRRGFETIERNVRLQAQLTGDLLDVSKSLTGRLHLDADAVSLKTAVADAVSQVSTAATAKDVTITVTEAAGPVIVRGDANRLRQVVWHLLANAIKFTPRGGSVGVKLESNSEACVTVHDTGPGIAPAFLPVIFDRFTQADSSPTRAAGGLGVGLSLVREIVERHGGEIEVRNASTGGAMFTVRLPLHDVDQQKATAAPAAAPAIVSSPPLNGIRVLLLDQDRDVRELLSVVLQQRGASVRLVGSVDEALEMLESWRPDVLLSDAASPEHDAYALVGKVQSLEADRGGRIPALALTNMANINEGARQLLSGVKRDLPKPVEPSILTAEIARLTGRERRRAQR
jgi:signal transduction histidine kinase/ActR/RegA family two-component response regulator